MNVRRVSKWKELPSTRADIWSLLCSKMILPSVSEPFVVTTVPIII